MSHETPRANVLVLDDEPSVRKVVQLMLKRAGFQVEGFEEETAYMEYLEGKSEAPHAFLPKEANLLIVDRCLKERTGEAMIQWTQKTRNDLRYLLITGQLMSDAEKECSQIPWLEKPFNSKALIEKVLEVLSEKQ